MAQALTNSVLSILTILIFVSNSVAQILPAYKNKDLTIAVRVADLLQRMTPEEKFFQLFMIPGEIKKGEEEKYKNGLFGFQVSAATSTENPNQQILQYNTSENARRLAKKVNALQKYFVEQTRLGIPIIVFDEALHGLVREGATVFPQSIGLAASWDKHLMQEVATAIAEEAAIRGINQVLSPVINIASDVRWGRTEETYGEDPFLTAEMGTAFIKAFEQKNIITTPKHFIANVGDGGRDSYPIYFSERKLREVHYPPFINAIQKAGSRSLMTAYNSIDGSPATANKKLLTETVKEQWKFNGFIISDASAVGGANVLHNTAKDYSNATAQAINNGLDVIFQTQLEHYKLFIPPFLDGRITQKRIDDAVTRVLKAKFELGLFEHPYVNEEKATTHDIIPIHQKLAKKAARASIVLLKNKTTTLPLSKDIGSIAIIGNDAKEARLGGYSGAGHNKVNIIHGFRSLLPHVKINYAPGVVRNKKIHSPIPSNRLWHLEANKKLPGLVGTYYNNIELQGTPAITRIDTQIDFHWTLYGPDHTVNNSFYSVRWMGMLNVPTTKTYEIGIEGNDGFRLYVNNKLLINHWEKQSYQKSLVPLALMANKDYFIRVEFKEPVGNGHIQLVWNEGIKDTDDVDIQQAIAASKDVDAVIVVAGIEEGEFRDRASLALPGSQEKMILQLAKTAKKIIVVLIGGSAITMDKWINQVDAVVDAWYPGEQGGHAIADIIMGNYNPSGKLPITFPIAEAQLPLVYNHAPTGRGDDYNNLTGLPLFPFGFGLSYTSFQFANLTLQKQQIKKGDSTMVSFTITNTGKLAGDEVVQLYIKDVLSSVSQPVLQLKGFERVHLAAGETKKISFKILPELLCLFDENMNSVIEPGEFSIMIGASSRDIQLKASLLVTDN